ncbi:sigma-70 family RNA polymerase sigma factor [Pseudaquabacterium pictum]|uniref:RNA polymerase sigma factor n=1 Tax=Pseudaquabacterium pictum TaxID=2315236 RepID=A0A480ASJ6_9BURK|nr:sigma-70 family RNA polymerase sigma factor [Rubrivivax pictus]GCL64639.1 RNA polymerase sigma factor [Rubrivivax pictus]
MKTPQTDWTARSQELAQQLARSALGDRAAFRRVYALSSGHLYAVILRIQRDRDLADDLLQEVYVSAWKAAGSFDAQRAQPLTWLTHIARNKAIDSLRRAQAQPRLESLHGDDDDDDRPDGAERLADDAPGPADLLERASDARQLGHCMEGLSAQQRQSVALAFFDGLSHAEVADQLRQPLGTVKSWVRRALLTLKTCLERSAQRDAGDGAVGI